MSSGKCSGVSSPVVRFAAVCFVALLPILASPVRAGETSLVPRQSEWRYLSDGCTTTPDWHTISFDDIAWPSGSGPLGYGENYVATLIPYGTSPSNKHISAFFRHSFSLDSLPVAGAPLRIGVNYDDGFVLYLNGQEIVRRGLGNDSVACDLTAGLHESGAYERIDISSFADLLIPGENLLASEVHQAGPTSSDLVWDLELLSGGSIVEFIWSGAVTARSATVKAKVAREGAVGRLLVSPDSALTDPSYSLPDTVADTLNHGVLSFATDGLAANRQYYYGVEIDGALDSGSLGRLHTFPDYPAEFRFAFGSCARTGSSHEVFNTILAHEPLFFLHTGDFHYENINVNDQDAFRTAFDAVLSSETQSHLYRHVPIAYMWDDHDFGPNNSDSTAPGKSAARLAYREYVPHYPLIEGEGTAAIYQAFSVGRVRFIVCDSRSARSPASAPDLPGKTMLGEVQKQWFQQELLQARYKYALIVWVNTLPWIGTSGDDGWHLYTHERRELAQFISDNRITNLCMVSGDAHMLAIDDGTNSDYSDNEGAAFPVMQAAALDQNPSLKGGPYSHGAFPGLGQFGLMETIDYGDSIRVNWSGRNYLDQELLAYSFTFQVDLPEDYSLAQNYPNPFNSSTSIQYEVPVRSKVMIDIINILGQKTKTLVNTIKSAGTHTTSWDGTDSHGNFVATGVYFYRLRATDFEETKKMLLVK